MTVSERVLEKLAEWQTPGAERQTLTVPGEGWSVAVTADRRDAMSCRLWEVNLRRTGPAPEGLTLQAWAGQVADRVTGLLEPLKVYEVDETRNEALLRSDGPSRRGDDVLYYEVTLKGTTEAGLRRYQGHRVGPMREQVPFSLTHEVLAKVAGDVAGDTV